jgi:fluoride exporter
MYGGEMNKFMLVAIGGCLGALSRYGISLLAVKLFSDKFPLGTLTVNLTGCFLIGLMFSLGSERNIVNPLFRMFFVTGFLGALTTFSTYGIESINFARNGLFNTSIINIAANNIGGFLLILIGLWIGRII